MTNKELINRLLEFPMDANVAIVYMSCNAYCPMEPDEIKFVGKEADGKFSDKFRFIERNGSIIQFDSKTWDYAKDGEPEFLDLITFPGN